MLFALSGTLQVTWKLALMRAEEYQKATSIKSISGETVPADHADLAVNSRYDCRGKRAK